MKIFLDTCIFFDQLVNERTERTISRLKNDDNHIIITSISVIGELVAVCMPNRLSDLQDILENLRRLDVEIIHPELVFLGERYITPQGVCCNHIDEYLQQSDIYGSSASDRLHLAFVISHDCEFFVTGPEEVKALEKPKDCGQGIKVVDIESLRKHLGYS